MKILKEVHYFSMGLKPNLDIKWDGGWKEYIRIEGSPKDNWLHGILVNYLGYKINL